MPTLIKRHWRSIPESRSQHDQRANRERREQEREAWRIEREGIDAFDEKIAMVCQVADIIAKAAMVAAGFHRHHGEWRRQRVPNNGN